MVFHRVSSTVPIAFLPDSCVDNVEVNCSTETEHTTTATPHVLHWKELRNAGDAVQKVCCTYIPSLQYRIGLPIKIEGFEYCVHTVRW